MIYYSVTTRELSTIRLVGEDYIRTDYELDSGKMLINVRNKMMGKVDSGWKATIDEAIKEYNFEAERRYFLGANDRRIKDEEVEELKNKVATILLGS